MRAWIKVKKLIKQFTGPMRARKVSARLALLVKHRRDIADRHRGGVRGAWDLALRDKNDSRRIKPTIRHGVIKSSNHQRNKKRSEESLMRALSFTKRSVRSNTKAERAARALVRVDRIMRGDSPWGKKHV